MEISAFREVTPCSLVDNKHTEMMGAVSLSNKYLQTVHRHVPHESNPEKRSLKIISLFTTKSAPKMAHASQS
jgi:hypothetical protein